MQVETLNEELTKQLVEAQHAKLKATEKVTKVAAVGQQALKAWEEQVVSLKAELDSRAAKLAAMEASVFEKSALVASLQGQLTVEAEGKAKALARAKELQAKLSDKLCQMSMTLVAAMLLSSSKDTAGVGVLEEKLKSEAAEKSEALERVRQLEAEAGKMSQEAAAKQAQLNVQSQEIADLKQKLTDLEALRASQVESLEKQVRSEANKTIEALSALKEREELQVQLGETKSVVSQLGAMKGLVTTLKMAAMEEAVRNDYLEKQLQAEASEKAEALARISELEAEWAKTLADEAEANKTALEVKEKVINELKQKLEDLEAIMAEKKTEQALKIAEVEARATGAFERLSVAEGELEDLRRKLQEKFGSVEEATAKAAATAAQEELSSALAELNAAREKVEELQAKLKAADEERISQDSAKEALQGTVRGLEEHLGDQVHSKPSPTQPVPASGDTTVFCSCPLVLRLSGFAGPGPTSGPRSRAVLRWTMESFGWSIFGGRKMVTFLHKA